MEGEAIKREGELIYSQAGVEVRSVLKDYESHSVWIGSDSYLFAKEELEEFGLRTCPSEMEQKLKLYNPLIISSLSRIRLSPEGLGLVLAHALIGEHETHENALRGDMQRQKHKFQRETLNRRG